MFESKEEVNKAIMDLKMFEGMDSIGIDNNPEEENEEYEETIAQVGQLCIFLHYLKVDTCIFRK